MSSVVESRFVMLRPERSVNLLAGRVDGGGVHAADDAAQVLARDAAGIVLAGDGAVARSFR